MTLSVSEKSWTMNEELRLYDEFDSSQHVEFIPNQMMILWDFPNDVPVVRYVSEITPGKIFPFRVPGLLPYKHGAIYNGSNKETYDQRHCPVTLETLWHLL